ncbi:MAG: DNA mismatch repair protein [Syntrophomonadaceae bacterium]
MIDSYRRREEKYKLLSNRIGKATSMVIKVKFILIALAAAQSIFFYKAEQYIIGGAFLSILFIGYLYLDKRHYSLIELKNTADLLAGINADGVKRLNGEWTEFKDNGGDLNPPEHPYSGDLDILGQDSLFQLINMSATPWGRRALADILLYPSSDIAEIESRQAAIAELAPLLGFRHRLKAEGLKVDAGEEAIRALLNWAVTSQPLLLRGALVAVIRTLPVLTIATLVLGILKVIPLFIPILMLVFQAALLFANRENSKKLKAVYDCNRSLVKMEAVFGLLEKRRFKSPVLFALQEKMLNETKDLPSKQIKSLSRLSSSIANRSHMLYIIIDLFLLLDLQLLVSLEKWKEQSGRHLKKWFEVLGEFEALSSLALLKYDHPNWVIPSFEQTSSPLIINAVQVGHPLINQDCVLNDIQFTKDHPIVLITGSNMSGKSTFLRTIGVNLILAYTGAPAFARAFSCQIMSLYTCMRVADNLQKNISSFYAEILRVKMIIDQVERAKVFFLLDELFKGTNSVDRHTAAKTIIHHLKESQASGMVSTHDLDLEVLENESKGKVLNYHFKENYKGDEISFDYKLRRGVSGTRNAIFLIKASGIDVF